jgi:SAM-dependent methyltransferase
MSIRPPSKHIRLPQQFAERARWQATKEHSDTLDFYYAEIAKYDSAEVVDLGSGPGTVAIPMCDWPNVKRVVCVERDSSSRRFLTEFGPAKLELALTGEVPWHLSFEDASIDAFVCRFCLHHFSYPQQVLAEIRRCLKKDGVALISEVHMSESCREATAELYRLREPDGSPLMTYYELMSAFREAGMAVRSLRAYEYQRGTFNDYVDCDSPDYDRLAAGWLALTDSVKAGLRWSGSLSGPFITYHANDFCVSESGAFR